MGSRETGRVGEDVAARFLERRGFKIVNRNFRRPWGEIDIIATQGDIVHFIEVKSVVYKSSTISREMRDLIPEERITADKIRKIVRTAESYMLSKSDNREFQVDSVGVVLNFEKKIAKCRLFEQILE